MERILNGLISLEEQLKLAVPDSTVIKKVTELREDIRQNVFSIAVVGEFKNGKSTFVNALLNQDIMPTGVTPVTATINIAAYGEVPSATIIRPDGSHLRQPLSRKVLEAYTAQTDFDAATVHHIRLELPSTLLANRTVIVDTPGVNDLNQHRVNITYEYLPRADLILFILDLTAPLKKTELLFLNDKLLKDERERLMFIGNFVDRLEDEEINETVSYIDQKLTKLLGVETFVYPMSALEAFTARQSQDADLLELSGLLDIEAEIMRRAASGERTAQKKRAFSRRYRTICLLAIDEGVQLETIAHQSAEALENQQKTAEEWLENAESWKGQIGDYLEKKSLDIYYMTKKSLRHFMNRLSDDVQQQIDHFHGGDIKLLSESQLPHLIQSSCKNWIEQHGGAIYTLLRKLEMTLSKGLSETFRARVLVESSHHELIYRPVLPVSKEKTGNASVTAGMIVGGTGAIAMLIGAPIVIPLIGMTGLPFMRDSIHESQLKRAKPKIKAEMDKYVNGLAEDFQKHLEAYILDEMKLIHKNAVDAFGKALKHLEVMSQTELDDRLKTHEGVAAQGDKGASLRGTAETLLGQLKREEELYERI